MNYRVEGSSVIMERPEDFDAEKIFECGQCFRWNLQEDGYWTGVALGHVLKLREEGDTVRFLCSEDDFLKVWMPYFDLGRDYTAVRARISIDPFTAKAAEFGKGIRILQQDAWETLCSFIVSQCNNIKRIKGIVERLCVLFGDQITYHGEVHYLFLRLRGSLISKKRPRESACRIQDRLHTKCSAGDSTRPALSGYT